MAQLEGTTLAGLTTTGANVTRDYVYTHDSLPSINIMQDDEDVVNGSDDGEVYEYRDRILPVTIEARAEVSDAQIATTLNQIAKEVIIAIEADITIGLSFVQDSRETGTDKIEVGPGEKQTGLLRMRWEFDYRSARTDPSA